MKALRPYQVEACNAIDREWSKRRSTLLVLATGLGKTFTASEVIKRRLARETGRVLWLAHRDELITQARDAIAAHCEGVRVGIEKAGTFANTYSLSEMHDHVVVASVQTLHEKRRMRFDPRLFGTVIIDEAHHATARSYREIVDHFPESKILGLTATPDRGDGVGLRNVFESVAFTFDIQAGISGGFLCPIRILGVNVDGLDMSSVKTTAGDLNQGQLAALVEVDRVHHEIAAPIAEHIGQRQCLIFCVSVAQSKALADVLQGYLPGVQIRHVDGSTPEVARRRILAEYASGEVQIVTNCAVLTEGFDSVQTSLIALARPTKSRALYTQMVGRGTRLAPGKVDCLVLDFKGNSGRHSLASGLDLLAGDDLPEDVMKVLRKAEKDGKVIDQDAIEQAQQEIADRIRREEIKRAQAAALSLKARYATVKMDAFNLAFSVKAAAPGQNKPASAQQVAQLVSFGYDADKARTLTFRQADELRDKLWKRRRDGLASFKQSRWLAKNGLSVDVPFNDCRKMMDEASANGWKVPDWARAKYGRPTTAQVSEVAEKARQRASQTW